MKQAYFILLTLTALLFSSFSGAKQELTDADKVKIQNLASKLDEETRTRFEQLHSQWYKTCDATPEIMLSSRSDARKKAPEFKALTDMGQTIIPLVVEKMITDDYFFTYLVYEAIQPDKSLLVNPDDRSMDVVQMRANLLAAKWINAQINNY